MNYRRGVHRIYLTLTLAWIALVVFMVVSDRWICEPLWRIVPTTYHELDKQYAAAARGPEEDFGYNFAPLAIAKMTWIVGLALPLPLIGYLLFLQLLPWIYRGFRPGTWI
jgi:hypothetical protein